ncbi:ABC transporter permease [Miniphocaeibacter massiliensis]|uniref:ABC transporter permease n=1 Tax=Miniphocaeibacter massiliensis TaxID=2041841 RepID=UPI000C1B9261|nr:ABC transporter permease [Miniphocaeibacter massiliensis]
MNKIYRKLAFQNIKNNKNLYIPYVITSSITIFMYYIFLAIQNSPDILNSRGGSYIVIVLGLGEYVITLFSAIFLIYTNKFLVRNRDRELGLINMLGVDKKGISKIMIYENIILTVVNIVLGIVASVIFSTVIFLLIGRYLSIELSTKFYVDFKSIIQTIVVYVIIFSVVLVGNIIRVRRLKPLDLLKEAEKGEKEPKANIIITIIGVICIGVGYYLANSTDNVLDAMTIFLVAVVLVIVGTYILFGTISIAVLKMFKKNKKIYYKSKNMTFISSLIFRMKQNAVSLANICVLSSMVLVMLVSTTALIGSKDSYIDSIFPKDIIIRYSGEDLEKENKIKSLINKNLENKDIELSSYSSISNKIIGAKGNSEQGFKVLQNFDGRVDFSIKFIFVYNIEDYNKINNKNEKLNDDEAILYSNKNEKPDKINIDGINLNIKENLDDVDGLFKNMPLDLFSTYTLIVKDEDSFYNSVMEKYGEKSTEKSEMKNFGKVEGSETLISFNLKGNEETINSWANKLENELQSEYGIEEKEANLTNKYKSAQDFVAINSGVFVVTILLSVLFLVATVMIIYYKQISEGMEDAKSISILSKIGMSKKETRKNISRQTRVVFFMPLVVSIIHMIAASTLVYNIIRIIGVGNREIFIKSCVITVIGYSLLYVIMYKLTSRAYLRAINSIEN